MFVCCFLSARRGPPSIRGLQPRLQIRPARNPFPGRTCRMRPENAVACPAHPKIPANLRKTIRIVQRFPGSSVIFFTKKACYLEFYVILEDFYNLFIYKRFERKVKIEVTNWQPCLFLRFAASCCQCLSSCCKIRNKKREYIKTSHDFFITGRFLSSMSISDSIVTSIFSKLSAMIAEIYTLIHTLPACCTALYVLFRAVRRQPCGYRSPASTHVKSVLSLPLRCARRN